MHVRSRKIYLELFWNNFILMIKKKNMRYRLPFTSKWRPLKKTRYHLRIFTQRQIKYVHKIHLMHKKISWEGCFWNEWSGDRASLGTLYINQYALPIWTGSYTAAAHPWNYTTICGYQAACEQLRRQSHFFSQLPVAPLCCPAHCFVSDVFASHARNCVNTNIYPWIEFLVAIEPAFSNWSSGNVKGGPVMGN